MAANLTILLLQTRVPEPVLHTAQRLECHRAADAGVELSVTGTVRSRYARRGREYVVLEARRRAPRRAPALDVDRDLHAGRAMSERISRALVLTGELLRAYSRRGNFHSEPAEADRLGLPGLVAQGMQVAAPAYGVLLDPWGDEFLEHGVVEMRFVAMVVEDDVATASVEIDGRAATFEVTSNGSDEGGGDRLRRVARPGQPRSSARCRLVTASMHRWRSSPTSASVSVRSGARNRRRNARLRRPGPSCVAAELVEHPTSSSSVRSGRRDRGDDRAAGDTRRGPRTPGRSTTADTARARRTSGPDAAPRAARRRRPRRPRPGR